MCNNNNNTTPHARGAALRFARTTLSLSLSASMRSRVFLNLPAYAFERAHAARTRVLAARAHASRPGAASEQSGAPVIVTAVVSLVSRSARARAPASSTQQQPRRSSLTKWPPVSLLLHNVAAAAAGAVAENNLSKISPSPAHREKHIIPQRQENRQRLRPITHHRPRITTVNPPPPLGCLKIKIIAQSQHTFSFTPTTIHTNTAYIHNTQANYNKSEAPPPPPAPPPSSHQPAHTRNSRRTPRMI